MRTHRGLAGVLLVALALGGCSAGVSSDPAASDAAYDVAPGVESAADGGGEAAYEESGVERVAAEPQHVIIEGHLTVVVDEPTEVAPRVSELVAQAGGYVESRSEQAPTADRAGRATLVLRLPASGVESTLDAIAALGELSDRNTNATDVTMQVTDLDARIAALETSIDRLLEMLAAAQRTEDLITIERTLQERQSDLESYKAQRQVLADRVSLATITLELTSVPPPPTVGPGGFWPGVQAGWQSLVDTLRGASVVVGVLIPWLVFLAIVGAVVVPLVRSARRRRAARPRPVPAYAYAGQPAYQHPQAPGFPQPGPAPTAPPTAAPAPQAPVTEGSAPAQDEAAEDKDDPASPEAKQARDGV